MRRFLWVALLTTALGLPATNAGAEIDHIRVGRAPGLSFLPIYILEDQKLIEKHAAAMGLGRVSVEYREYSSGQVMNEALLSGTMDLATGGLPPFLILWARAVGTPREIKALAAVSANPSYLNTRNPNVKTIRDFTAQDRISVAAVRASQVAILLQMAAEKEFGVGQHGKLDELTVSMPQLESVVAMTSQRSEVTAHFTVAPFHQVELRDPRVHTVLRSRDILGGIGTVVVAYTTANFHNENPKVAAALFAALSEAGQLVQTDPRRAATIYLSMAKDRMNADELTDLLRDPDYNYLPTPAASQRFADFMFRTGALPRRPERWQDMFFPEAHSLSGS